jgi:hypothetical protein
MRPAADLGVLVRIDGALAERAAKRDAAARSEKRVSWRPEAGPSRVDRQAARRWRESCPVARAGPRHALGPRHYRRQPVAGLNHFEGVVAAVVLAPVGVVPIERVDCRPALGGNLEQRLEQARGVQLSWAERGLRCERRFEPERRTRDARVELSQHFAERDDAREPELKGNELERRARVDLPFRAA